MDVRYEKARIARRGVDLPVLALADLPPPPPGRRGWPWTEAPSTRFDASVDWPALGVVTPSLDQGEFLEAAIRSVLLQGYPRLEYYIEDGGSRDRSIAILEKYAPFVSGWSSARDAGQATALNTGFARMDRAEWIGWLNSDDYYLPGALFHIGEWARSDPEDVALVGSAEAIDRRGRVLWTNTPMPDISGVTLRRWRTHEFAQPACFFRRNEFDRIGGLDEALDCALDFDLWVRLGRRGSFARTDRLLACAVIHARAKTQRSPGDSLAETVGVLFQHGFEADGQQLVRDLYEELDFFHRALRPLTDSRPYQRFVRPLVARWLDPPQFRGWRTPGRRTSGWVERLRR